MFNQKPNRFGSGRSRFRLGLSLAVVLSAAPSVAADKNPSRQALFGDLHVHSANSFDSYTVDVRGTPDDAYRFAKGEAITHPMGYPVRLRGGPLDFYAVTDHAEYLGVLAALHNPDHPLAEHPLAIDIRTAKHTSLSALNGYVSGIVLGVKQPPSGLEQAPQLIGEAWAQNIAAAERHNDPGKFTTFLAYEYTATPSGVMLHRNIVFAGNKAAGIPFSAEQSSNPEDLWDWLDDLRERGIEALSIPHNSNWSMGRMFERTDTAGAPFDSAYAKQRLRNEPLVEITQIKGTSDTHPELSPNDEWADFEIMSSQFAGISVPGVVPVESTGPSGEYVREALQSGLLIEQAVGENPYQFGLIGSSDGHNAASPVEENHYFGKLGLVDGTPSSRGGLAGEEADDPQQFPFVPRKWSAAGLAAVWAEENTRESIYSAFRRRETFATTGPRIQLRLFAGYKYEESLLGDPAVFKKAYARGVPMGGELTKAKRRATPKFLVWALRDKNESWLDRAQIIKGWVEDGESKEQVFDVACAGGAAVDAVTHRCPVTRATVNLADCSVSVDSGAVELKTLWQDPTFDRDQSAFYYLRVLENPSCRWSTWDSLRAGKTPRDDIPATLQERAWSSPIWYTP